MNDTDLKIHLGLRIRHLRKKYGLTQEELGEKISRNQRQISLIEAGSSFPNPETLVHLAEVFNCSIKDIFDFEPIENVKNLKDEMYNIIENLSEDKLKTLYIIGKNI